MDAGRQRTVVVIPQREIRVRSLLWGFLLTKDQRDTRISPGSLWKAKNFKLAAVVSHISRKTSEMWGTPWSLVRTESATMVSLSSFAAQIKSTTKGA
jgi:hypothetical protein